MLVLTRKAGETVVVGDNIRITVIECSSGFVRLGFVAPDEVSIYREEIYVEIAKQKKAAEDGE
ncbi:MAG: carbon storage regulator CsrA [bacterium]|nr:carbon storage regulator CsrA [bacterium]